MSAWEHDLGKKPEQLLPLENHAYSPYKNVQSRVKNLKNQASSYA